MSERTCRKCGAAIPDRGGRGRPRVYCSECRPPREWGKYKKPAPRTFRLCPECGTGFVAPLSRKCCSEKCRNALNYKHRPRKPCTYCGGPTGVLADDSRWPHASHPACRPGYDPEHGKRRGGMESWECAGCGARCERPRARGQRPKWCSSCRSKRGGGYFVTPTVRAEIYERDGWACGLCGDGVDASLIGSRDLWRPSLDHIIPQSKGGTDSPENLRLAHWWCNSVRGAGVNDDLFEEVA